MTSIGNDIVDLTSPDSIGKSLDRRFIARVFTPEEQERIDRSDSPDTTLWMVWAAKEAAFKAVIKLKPGLSFTHRAYVVTSPLSEDSPREATITSGDCLCLPTNARARSERNEALKSPLIPPCQRENGGDFNIKENILCPGYHRESAHRNEHGKPAPILLKQTNGNAMSIQERGVVMTPAGPVDAFFTLSSQRVHCVAAMRNINGGAPAAAPVHVLEERREGPFDPSVTVRRAAINHLASVLKASPYYIDIRRDKTTHGYGAPRVFIEGSRTDIDISLSHDGQFIAFAVHY
ncbi:MAG: 4'-phosphopantetheinyl transferase superfamily protein [Syntrophus sp. (in: bacteria)]